jgi:hypothetical protein
MRTILFVAILAVAAVAGGCLTQRAEGQKSRASERQPSATRRPVLVELYTSEGCSSCPPADRALKFLAEQQPVANAEIIPLAFHVDYWDHLGWKDRFSSATYSRRQELYVEQFGVGSSYTPEMVVDGRSEFIGSDTGRAAKTIEHAAEQEKGNVSATLDGGQIEVSISALSEHHPATVFLAVTEDGITSNVKSGENAGSTFEHSSVVRSLTTLGLIDKDLPSFEAKGTLPQITDWNREKGRFVVFVQDNITRRILAVGVAGM